jgi:hypothetical protein
MQKIIGVALIAGGVWLIVMGHNITQAVGQQIAHTFTGETPKQAIYYYVGGAVLCVLGLGAVFKPDGRTGI